MRPNHQAPCMHTPPARSFCSGPLNLKKWPLCPKTNGISDFCGFVYRYTVCAAPSTRSRTRDTSFSDFHAMFDASQQFEPKRCALLKARGCLALGFKGTVSLLPCLFGEYPCFHFLSMPEGRPFFPGHGASTREVLPSPESPIVDYSFPPGQNGLKHSTIA